MEENASQAGADERPRHRNGRIAPVEVYVSCNGKNRLSVVRTTIASGMDGIAGSGAKRKTDCPVHTPGEVGTKTRSETVLCNHLRRQRNRGFKKASLLP